MMSMLEKVRVLEEYLGADTVTVDPVLDMTLDKILTRERARTIESRLRLAGHLAQFERDYTMNSADFQRSFESGELGDAMDFVEWAATIEMLANVDRRLALLETASRG